MQFGAGADIVCAVLRAWILLGISAGSVCLAQDSAPRATVYFAQDSDAISNYQENAPVVRAMVDALVLAVTEKPNLDEAWRSLVQPADRVGIKVSARGGPLFSTHRAVVDAIAEGISRAGVPTKNIVVWDRADMVAAGFARPPRDFAVRAIEPITGYNLKAIFSSPVVGRLIWGDALFSRRNRRTPSDDEPEQFGDESHWSRVLCAVTKIINVPVLSSEESCGVAGCLYNVTIPNLDNWRRFAQEPDPSLVELYRDEHVGRKVVLNIVDGLIAQFAGGPDFQPNYAWNYATIFASRDPVALDATALREIDEWRAQARLPKLAKRGSYLQTAAAAGMGQCASERIDLKKVGVR